MLPLVGTKYLQSNVVVFVSGDRNTQSFFSQSVDRATGQPCYNGLSAIYCTKSAWTTRKSSDDNIWYILPKHVTTFENQDGPIPALPATNNQVGVIS